MARWPTDKNTLTLHEGSPVLHYGQGCFEGMKAITSVSNKVLLFRPDQNLKRFNTTARRLLMPEVSEKLFFDGIYNIINNNLDWVPPYGHNASLYIRPILIGVGENIGISPAQEYLFHIFVNPVGPYYEGNEIPSINLNITNFDRVPTNGIGHVKAVGNYAGGLYVVKEAREKGADEALYLDPVQHEFFEETNSSNILFLIDGKVVTPDSQSILPSITKDSILTIAAQELGLETEVRRVSVSER